MGMRIGDGIAARALPDTNPRFKALLPEKFDGSSTISKLRLGPHQKHGHIKEKLRLGILREIKPMIY